MADMEVRRVLKPSSPRYAWNASRIAGFFMECDMAEQQSQYEHQFEDLNGRVDDTPVVDIETDDATDAQADASVPDGLDGLVGDGAETEDATLEPQSGDTTATPTGDDEARRKESLREAEMQGLREEVQALRQSRTEEERQAQGVAMDTEISEARQAMLDAQEEGDMSVAAEHQDKLVGLQVKKQMMAAQQAAQPQQQQAEQQPQVPEEAQQWVSRNKWFQSGEDKERAHMAVLIEQQARSQGYDPNSRAMYDEIDRQLERLDYASGKKKAKAPASPPTNGMGAQSGSATVGKVTITREDKATMMQFGLDPDNPTHLKTWAREKRAAAQ